MRLIQAPTTLEQSTVVSMYCFVHGVPAQLSVTSRLEGNYSAYPREMVFDCDVKSL